MVRKRITKSLAVQKRARRRIPGMSQLLSKRPDQFSLGTWPGYFHKAKGVMVWDLDGNRYIDMSIGGIGANVLGYADPDIDAAVMKAVRLGTSSSLNCAEEVDLADLLCEIHPWAEAARFARTGGESAAMAVRIARAHTGRDTVLFCGYHGWHDWYLSANLQTETLDAHLLAGLEPAGVPRGLAGTAIPFPYNNTEQFLANYKKVYHDLAAVIMEPIRSQWPTDGFLETVRACTTESGAVMIFDEISAALRMNSGGAHLLFKVTPDMAVFSKAIGNGYPIGAVIGRADVMASAQKTFISSTYWTERIGPTAALATLKKHRALDAGKHLMEIGKLVQESWRRIADRHGIAITISGIAPLGHFTFDTPDGAELKAFFVQEMLDRGFLASTSFYSMYAHTKRHVAAYSEAADRVFAKIKRIRDRGQPVGRRLRGEPAAMGFRRLA